MSGMEKILRQILKEGEEAAAEWKEKTRMETERIWQEERAKTEEAVGEIHRQLEVKRQQMTRRVREDGERENRLQLLKMKQKILREVENAAGKIFMGMDTESYFSVLERMLERVVLPGDGILCLAETDLARMPGDFPGKVKQAARRMGGTLTIRGERNREPEGFVLIYGRMEINATWRALAGERRAWVQEAVSRILWRTADE